MNNLSTASTDISSQIGALELGDHMGNHSDGALEAAGANMAVGPTEVNCGRNPTIVFRCASEGALEAAGLNPNNLPTLPRHVYGGSC